MLSREALHALGVRRRAIVVGEGEHLDHLLRSLGPVRGGIDYDFIGVVSRDPTADLRPAAARRLREPALGARRAPDRRADRHRLGLQRARPAPDGRGRAPQRREGPRRAEDDRAAGPARGVRAGPGTAALRAAPAGLRRNRLGDQARVRPRRQLARRRRRAAGLARDRGADQADLQRAGLLPRPAHRARGADVPHVQVPDDARGRRRAAQRARRAERGGGGAVQDPRRPADHARRRLPAALLDRRAAEHAQRPARRDEPRRPAPAAGRATTRCSRSGTASGRSCSRG